MWHPERLGGGILRTQLGATRSQPPRADRRRSDSLRCTSRLQQGVVGQEVQIGLVTREANCGPNPLSDPDIIDPAEQQAEGQLPSGFHWSRRDGTVSAARASRQAPAHGFGPIWPRTQFLSPPAAAVTRPRVRS
jgi:hypothetical protein